MEQKPCVLAGRQQRQAGSMQRPQGRDGQKGRVAHNRAPVQKARQSMEQRQCMLSGIQQRHADLAQRLGRPGLGERLYRNSPQRLLP
jgi:hypothetical protein